MSEPAGTLVDKYAIVRLLGEGGMGEVYEAKHTLVGQRYALKLLRADLAADDKVVKRMMREARAAAEIGHPNIVQTHDFGTLENGSCYLAMELLEGEGLDALIKRHQTLEVQTSVAIILQVLSALVSAHQKGIVHRDLKPENVFIAKAVGGGAVVKLLDFGISKFKSTDADTLRLTHTGAVMGTPYYMSPEQAGGAKDVDERSDLWSVGVVLYQMLTGKLPFTGDNYNQLILKIVTQPFVAPRRHCPDIPERLEAVIVKALQKDVQHRFQKSTQMIEALLPFYERSESEAGRFVLRENILRNPQRVSGQRQVVQEAFNQTAPAGAGGCDPAIEETLRSGEEDPIGIQTGPERDNPFEGGRGSGEVALAEGDPDTEPTVSDSGSRLSATATRYSGPSPRLSMDELSDEGLVVQNGRPSPELGRSSASLGKKVKRTTMLAAVLGLVAVGALVALGVVLFGGRDKASSSSDASAASPGALDSTMESGDQHVEQRLISPARPAAPRTAPAVPIVIRLQGLPLRAKAWVDGKLVEHPIHMKADGASHLLKVQARGYEDYEASFIATSALESIPLAMRKRQGKFHPGRKPNGTMRTLVTGARRIGPFARARPRAMPRPMKSPRVAPAAPPMRRPRKTDGVYGNPYGE